MTKKEIQELIAKKKMQDFIRQEVMRQTRGILKKSSTRKESSEIFELSSGIHDDIRDSGIADLESIDTPDSPETAVLLDGFENNPNLIQQPAKNRLENASDSLLDIRLERLRRDARHDGTRRFVNNCSRSSAAPEVDRNRGELYCCYAVYFFLLFWVFLFAIFQVWLPIIKAITDGKQNVSQQIDKTKLL